MIVFIAYTKCLLNVYEGSSNSKSLRGGRLHINKYTYAVFTAFVLWIIFPF